MCPKPTLVSSISFLLFVLFSMDVQGRTLLHSVVSTLSLRPATMGWAEKEGNPKHDQREGGEEEGSLWVA